MFEGLSEVQYEQVLVTARSETEGKVKHWDRWRTICFLAS